MSTTYEQLEGAALSLARSGTIKDRLATAFRDHLTQVSEEDLPESLRGEFRACHEALVRERPQPGEDAVRATVRKLSSIEADELACNLVRLYGAYVREVSREAAAASVVINGAMVSEIAAARPKKSVPQVISLYAHEG